MTVVYMVDYYHLAYVYAFIICRIYGSLMNRNFRTKKKRKDVNEMMLQLQRKDVLVIRNVDLSFFPSAINEY